MVKFVLNILERCIRNRLIKSLCLILLIALQIGYCSQTRAQSVIASAGGGGGGSNGFLSWTVGEVVVQTFYSDDYLLTQGFHQSNLIISSVRNVSDPSFQVSVFPNPTHEKIVITITSQNSQSIAICLFDCFGRYITKISGFSSAMQINVSDYQPGIYFLRISEPATGRMAYCKVMKN